MEEETGIAESGSATISWRRTGEGEPLVLLNGYAGRAVDWDPVFVEALAGFATVLCPDHRGMGDSSTGEESLTVGLMARDVIAVLDDLGIGRAPVVGWSMGGFVAQEVAAGAPDRVSHLVLLGTDHGGPEAISADPERWAQLTDHSGSPREQASRLISLLFPDPPASQIDAEFGELVAEARAALDPSAVGAQEEAMDRWHAEPAGARLAKIAAPVLCAAGADDAVIPAANTDLLAAALPGAWRASFPGTGHAFMAQEPARLAALIRTFLAR